MAALNLGTATVSARVVQLLRESYERATGESVTAAQALVLVRADIRSQLALRVKREKRIQREDADRADDTTLDGEVTIA